ncbi:ubiquitin-40S ribosomal protein S27a [Plasmodium falciparum NF54]|uniref:Ubiquitin-40S ribosomal protein S27a n=1 Tax=Plasmodium falciparum (isolate NF54) TaxID=5843 RepID=W7JZI0_PLAFO|nr:ubiquitin-40S ribosomal protein S27a [Plasmodium falciparum NF54]
MDAYTLNLNFGLLGGAKKKKKKVYKKPKKEKHKKKKVKLAVLKFYKVGDDGKVFRLKRQCDNCAPGTLMASHFDRDYCGRCHLTIMKK